MNEYKQSSRSKREKVHGRLWAAPVVRYLNKTNSIQCPAYSSAGLRLQFPAASGSTHHLHNARVKSMVLNLCLSMSPTSIILVKVSPPDLHHFIVAI